MNLLIQDSVTRLLLASSSIKSRDPYSRLAQSAQALCFHSDTVTTKNTQVITWVFFVVRCRRRDSNSHTLRYTILSRARLPFRHSGMSLA